MKNFITTILLLLGCSGFLWAEDIAIIGVNADNDSIMFVALSSIPANTSIYFTDNEWTGSGFTSGEGIFEYVTGGSGLAPGQVVIIDGGNGSVDAGPGSISSTSGSFNPSNGKDPVYAFFGNNSSSPTKILSVFTDGGLTAQEDPTSETVGQDAIIVSLPNDEDNAAYTGSRVFPSTAAAIAAIQASNNYTQTDGTGNQAILFDPTNFNIGSSSPVNFNTCFTDNCDLFNIVPVQQNGDNDNWSCSGGTYEVNAFCGGGCTDASELWLISNLLNYGNADTIRLNLEVDEDFSGSDLIFQYSTDYAGSGNPNSATWTVLETITSGTYPGNTQITVDLTPIGNDLSSFFLGVEYNAGGGIGTTSGYELSNLVIEADTCTPANVACNLVSTGLDNVVCDDNGTPSDSTDDFFRFDLNPTGVGLSGGYSVLIQPVGSTPFAATAGAQYSSASSFAAPTGVAAGTGDYRITVIDSAVAGCVVHDTVFNPTVCFTPPPCTIEVDEVIFGSCQANGNVETRAVILYDNVISDAFTVSINGTQVAGPIAYTSFASGDTLSLGTISGGNQQVVVTAADTASRISLILSAILPDQASDQNGDGSVNFCDEYFEVTNASGIDIDISGYQVSDAVRVRHTFPAGTIIADGQTIRVFNSDLIPSQSCGSGVWNNGGDTGTLLDPNGDPVSVLTYSSSSDDVPVTQPVPGFATFCQGSDTVTAPICCGSLRIQAVAACEDAAGNMAGIGQYFLRIDGLSGGAGAPYTVGIDTTGDQVADVTVNNYDGSSVYTLQRAHSGQGNAVTTVIFTDNLGVCSDTVEVVETLCGYVTSNGPNASGVFCDGNFPAGNILVQSAPGSFQAGGTSGQFQYYFIADAATGLVVQINGTGLFSGLPDGEYIAYAVNVRANDAAALLNLLQPGSNPADVIGKTGLAASFCYTVCGPARYRIECEFSIGSTVFRDYTPGSVSPDANNARQDAGEMGVRGVAVFLYEDGNTDGSPDGAALDSTLTNAQGDYLFDSLRAGSYLVGIGVDNFGMGGPLAGLFSSAGADAPNADQDSTDDGRDLLDPVFGILSNFYTLDEGQEPTSDGNSLGNGGVPDDNANQTVDFGFVTGGGIGDFVWFDDNENGQQDPGEPGIAGVEVILYDQFGTRLNSDTTNLAGRYEFRNLRPGNYVLEVIRLPLGGSFTFANVGNDTTDSDVNPTTGFITGVSAVPEQFNGTFDAGVKIQRVTLGDYVWLDLDKDGAQDAQEPGVRGIRVRVYDNVTGNVVDSALTDNAGAYLFDKLLPGTYFVEFDDLPTGYSFTTPDATTDNLDSDADTLTGRTPAVSLFPGDVDRSLDAGLTVPFALLGDYVFFDTNEDGVQDAGENGVTNVLVRLLDGSGTQIDSQLTDGDGLYAFDALLPGTYQIIFDRSTLPLNFGFTRPNQTANDSLDSDADTLTSSTPLVTLAPGEINRTVDAGLIPNRGLIGDLVFDDIDQDGQQDADEPGLPNVWVILYDGQGNKLDSTFTNANGDYIFGNLPPGAYRIGLNFNSFPANYRVTAPNQGGDGTDSDIDPTTGLSPIVNLPIDGIVLDLDAGLTPELICSCTALPFAPNNYAFLFTGGNWPGSARFYNWVGGNGTFTTFANGTALLTGSIVNVLDASITFDVKVRLINRKDWAMWSAQGGKAKGPGFGDFTTWDFFEIDSLRSRLVGTNGIVLGDTFKLSHMPVSREHGPQLGEGANDRDGDFGLSGWFFHTSTSGNYSGTGDFNLDIDNCQCTPPATQPAPSLAGRLQLEGNYNPATGLMGDQLQSVMPTSQPYNTAPWNYAGSESFTTLPNEVVDWVLIELRDPTDLTQVLGRQAALLRTDGLLIDTDGSLVELDLPQGVSQFHLTVLHRNHLAVTSANALGQSNGKYHFDFSSNLGDLYRDMTIPGHAATVASDGTVVLYLGDASGDQQINSLDLGGILQGYFQSGHKQGDTNLDGVINSLDVGRTLNNYFIRGHQPK